MHLRSASKGLLFITMAILGFSNAEAASVSKINGDKIFIDIDAGENDVTESARFFVMVGGKKRAVIEVIKVKGQRALAKNLKGKPEVGGTLAPLQGSGSNSKSVNSGGSSKKKSSKHASGALFRDFTYGFMAGYNINEQDVTTSGVTIAMPGTGFSFKGMADMPVSGNLGLIGRVGATQFSVAGSGFKKRFECPFRALS